MGTSCNENITCQEPESHIGYHEKKLFCNPVKKSVGYC